MNARALVLASLLVLASCEARSTFTAWEWERLESLANLPDPPPDHSNAAVGDPAAEALGHRLYFDPSFSGPAQLVDMLGRPIASARAPRGEEMGISCNSCHQVDRAGADHTSVPRHVSIGAGAYDVNGQQTLNAAHYPLLYWNGRSDSLWSQILAVVESDVSMGGDRLKVAWRLADAYRAEYEAAFPDWPLPAAMDGVAAQQARLEADGSCRLDGESCPAPHCSVRHGACLPRFPLRGKPGYEGQLGLVPDGTLRGCQRGQATTPPEPWDDAYDCMELADQRAVTRVFVNFAKAIAAYEVRLVSRDSAFDRFVNEGPGSTVISAAARRGARLFVGKASCIDCHRTPLLSDGDFHDIGVPQLGVHVPGLGDCPRGGWCDCVSDDVHQPGNCLPWGHRDGLRKLQASRFRRDSFYSDDAECQRTASLHDDPLFAREHPGACDGRVASYSRLRVDADSSRGAWRTPSLRDVAHTAPYMHNGLYATLEEVIWHYDGGGSSGDPATRDPRLSPLGLSDRDVADLVAFLHTLTGAPLPAEVAAPPPLPPPSPF
jgi:cytochrome c peroxidase